MKQMVVEIQERQKVAVGHQETAAVEQRGDVVDQINTAAAQRDTLARKQTEVGRSQADIKVCLVARKENPLQSTTAASDPESQLKQSGKGPRKAEDVIDEEHLDQRASVVEGHRLRNDDLYEQFP